MPTITSEQISTRLGSDYEDLRPLLNYLKARLKYDTARWIRTYGTKDDIVFSTRIKSFERVYDKLIRKAVPLTSTSNLLDIALSGDGYLDDLLGIRFICFDAFQIYNLARYFLSTERVATSQRTFYISSKTDTSHPIYRYLQSNGFKPIRKEGREYEDINFILRFSHPIDKYFSSGLETFKSLAQRADSASSRSAESALSRPDEKLATVNALFDTLKDKPHLISSISQLPIECQIVTATQHIYNKTQRPHYEYIIQAKDGDSTISAVQLEELTERLDVLKLNLVAAELCVFSLHKKFGIRYEASPRINPGQQFELDGRLPSDILGQNVAIYRINGILQSLIDPQAPTPLRVRQLRKFFKEIQTLNARIADRSSSNGDVASGDLLHIADLDSISHPTIVYWSFQRLIILIICMVLLYAHDEPILSDTISRLRFGPASDNYKLADVDIVVRRLFEKLEHIDNAINAKLLNGHHLIDGWKDGYFEENLFSDPLIQWRYASFMYSKREYDNALQEMRVGVAILQRLQDWERDGVLRTFDVPDASLFVRRIVEYEVCSEVAKLKFSPNSVAGALELCNCILPRSEEWIENLKNAASETKQLSERARCICLQVLIRLCSLSAGGLKGPALAELRNDCDHELTNLRRAMARKEENSGEGEIENRTWWLLTESIMTNDESRSKDLLELFRTRNRELVHHPIERKQFEQACATLIMLWNPSGSTVTDRNDFVANALTLVKEQIDRIARSDALSHAVLEQSRQLTNLLTEIIKDLKETKSIENHEGLKAKLTKLAGDTFEHIVVDTAVAGIRSILGI